MLMHSLKKRIYYLWVKGGNIMSQALGSGCGNDYGYALILVLFILLVIIGAAWLV